MWTSHFFSRLLVHGNEELIYYLRLAQNWSNRVKRTKSIFVFFIFCSLFFRSIEWSINNLVTQVESDEACEFIPSFSFAKVSNYHSVGFQWISYCIMNLLNAHSTQLPTTHMMCMWQADTYIAFCGRKKSIEQYRITNLLCYFQSRINHAINYCKSFVTTFFEQFLSHSRG